MPKYQVVFHAQTGGKHVEEFEAASSDEARKAAIRFRNSHGSSGKSFRLASVKKIED